MLGHKTGHPVRRSGLPFSGLHMPCSRTLKLRHRANIRAIPKQSGWLLSFQRYSLAPLAGNRLLQNLSRPTGGRGGDESAKDGVNSLWVFSHNGIFFVSHNGTTITTAWRSSCSLCTLCRCVKLMMSSFAPLAGNFRCKAINLRFGDTLHFLFDLCDRKKCSEFLLIQDEKTNATYHAFRPQRRHPG